jgi:DNA-3-methyladenine glycosylase
VSSARIAAGMELTARFAPADFQQPTLSLSRRLIGSILVHNSPEGLAAGRIVETEAYLGPRDRASHSFDGRMTERNRAMFGEKGRAYIYLIYGMHRCFNVVSGKPGLPQAVLIRALEPLAGMDLMRHRLGSHAHARDHTLCRGPGKLCKALGIGTDLYGADLRGTRLFLVPRSLGKGETVAASPRINIAYAEEYTPKPWRFYMAGNSCVSGPSSLNRR